MKAWQALQRVNLKTVYWNFKLFPFSVAIKLPLFISRRVMVTSLAKITLKGPVTTGMVQIGYGRVGIFDFRRSRAVIGVSGELVCRGKTRIGHGSKIVVGENGRLELGNNFMISAESAIVANKGITIGNDVLLSWGILIMDDDFHKIYDTETGALLNPPAEIVIGNKVWLGAGCTVLKKASIADHVIIAANTTLSGNLAEKNVIYGGNPLKILKRNVAWSL